MYGSHPRQYIFLTNKQRKIPLLRIGYSVDYCIFLALIFEFHHFDFRLYRVNLYLNTLLSTLGICPVSKLEKKEKRKKKGRVNYACK